MINEETHTHSNEVPPLSQCRAATHNVMNYITL